MTHTLHRTGTKEELTKDYIVFIMAERGYNLEGSKEKYQEFVRKAQELGAIKIGDALHGNILTQNGLDNLLANITDQAAPLHAIFNDIEKVKEMFSWLKERDLGLSANVSGLAEHVHKCCQEVGIKRHTVEHSLGRWGRIEKLPTEEVLKVHTMCGHQMVTVGMINQAVEDIKAGRKTPEKAADELYTSCACGVFNTERAARLLKSMAE
ncbi:MAG: hypothetical protein ACOYJ1_07715 [Peptococcales bacterium]|jgi:hypothetical protein